MDVTVVGSGPDGLAAAVICARADLSVRVFEAQSTLGGGARTLPAPEYPGVSHDICRRSTRWRRRRHSSKSAH